MSVILAAAKQELLCLRRERLPQLLLVVFVVMVSLSALIGWLTNHTVTQVWEQVRAEGLTQAANPFDGVAPLYYVRNTVIYIVLIGALMALIMGVVSALRDRRAHTVDLVLSRPITVRGYVVGKLAGISVGLAGVLALVGVITWASVAVIINSPLSGFDSARLVGFYAIAWLFLVGFAVLGLLAGTYATQQTTALLVPIAVWSVMAFVLPQIGTAAHPVSLLNPIPAVPVSGGPFAALNTWVGPLSVTEQFKTAANVVLGSPHITGRLPVSLAILGLAVAACGVALMATRRHQLREALRD